MDSTVIVYLYGIVKPPEKDKKSTGKSWKSTWNFFFGVVRHRELSYRRCDCFLLEWLM